MRLCSYKKFLEIIKDSTQQLQGRKIVDANKYIAFSVIADQNNYIADAKLIEGVSTFIHTKVLIDKENPDSISYSCNCQHSSHYSGCKHVAAILIKLMSLDDTELPYQPLTLNKTKEQLADQSEHNYLNSISQAVIRYVKNNIDDEELFVKFEDKMNIEAFYENNIIRFKIGNNKQYYIKDLEQFVDDVEKKQEVHYGSSLVWTHDYESFNDDSKKIFNLINKLVVKNLYLKKERFGKGIPLNSGNIDEIYSLFSKIGINGVNFKNSEELLEIEVKKVADGYQFANFTADIPYIRGKEALYFIEPKHQSYIFIKNDFHGKKDVLKLIMLLNNSQYDNLYVDQKDVEDFNRYLLDDIRDEIVIHGDYPLSAREDEKITIYGDVSDEGQISFLIESKINDQTIYAIDEIEIPLSKRMLQIKNFFENYADRVDYSKHCVYFKHDDQKTYNMINEGLAMLQQYAEVLVSEALKNLGQKTEYGLSVGVKVDNNLLAIDLDAVNISKSEIINILKHYRRKKKYYKLKNGEVLSLDSADLKELDEVFTNYNVDLNDVDDGHVDVNLYRSFDLYNRSSSDTNLTYIEDSSFKDLIKNFQQQKLTQYSINSNYENILRSYQKFGVKWLHMLKDYGFNGILADDMGLGKTLQIIALLDSIEKTQPSIVICPSSLILNWVDEVKKFSSSLKVCGIYGTGEQRENLIGSYQDFDLLVTSYEYIRRDLDIYKSQKIEFLYIILDEAQYIKNKNTKNAYSVKKLTGKHKLALTGTPIENTLAELWSIFDFLMPGYLYSYSFFKNNYEIPIVKFQDESAQQALKTLIEPFILRRNKKEVLKELPDKIQNKIEFAFNPQEEKLYLANLALVNQELNDKIGNHKKLDNIKIIAMLTKLRQLCIDPRLVYDDIVEPSSKIKGCMDLVDQLVANQKKILIFSSFTTVLDLIAAELTKKNYSFYLLTGATKKQERHRLVNEFQNDNTKIFLISLKAGGTGLNLTAAQAVIHLDPWWNMSAQNQATDRAYRIGQKNDVQEFKLVMKDSVEDKIVQMQETKKNLADTFVENNAGSLATMNVEEILNLFK